MRVVPAPEARSAKAAARGLGTEARSAKAAALTGTEYLRRAANAEKAAPPAAFRPVRETLQPLTVEDRYQAATPSLPDSLYHLVDRDRAERYTVMAEALAAGGPALRVSGPFPPFAFTPELL